VGSRTYGAVPEHVRHHQRAAQRECDARGVAQADEPLAQSRGRLEDQIAFARGGGGPAALGPGLGSRREGRRVRDVGRSFCTAPDVVQVNDAGLEPFELLRLGQQRRKLLDGAAAHRDVGGRPHPGPEVGKPRVCEGDPLVPGGGGALCAAVHAATDAAVHAAIDAAIDTAIDAAVHAALSAAVHAGVGGGGGGVGGGGGGVGGGRGLVAQVGGGGGVSCCCCGERGGSGFDCGGFAGVVCGSASAPPANILCQGGAGASVDLIDNDMQMG